MSFNEAHLSLTKVPLGHLVFVSNVRDNHLKAKLLEMGIVRGQALRVLFKAPLGDPIAVDVNGYILSLRLDEADQIQVEASEHGNISGE